MCIRDRGGAAPQIHQDGDDERHQQQPERLLAPAAPAGGLYACILGHGLAPVSYTHLDVYKRQVIPQGQSVTLFAGKRKLTLKPSDLDYYRGERGRRGAKLPRGLQRVDRIEIEPVTGAEPVAGENQEG